MFVILFGWFGVGSWSGLGLSTASLIMMGGFIKGRNKSNLCLSICLTWLEGRVSLFITASLWLGIENDEGFARVQRYLAT